MPNTLRAPIAPDVFQGLIEAALEATTLCDPSAGEALQDALGQFSFPHSEAAVRDAVSALDQMEFEQAREHLEKVNFDE